MACDLAGLKIIDVSDPYNPVLVRSLSIGGNALGINTIKIEAKIYAFVAIRYAGLKIVDVTDP